jgi:pyruvate dehydrogenase E2 component (dihydrolipoamide acetyltransferase)
MATVVRMPAALAGVTEGAIASWLKAPGDAVAMGEPLAEIETEKAIVEYEAEAAGTVGRLLAEPGDSVAVGVPIAVILAPGEGEDAIDPALNAAGAVAAEPPGAAAPELPPSAAPEPAIPPSEGGRPGFETAPRDRLFASPIVRRLAKERDIDLSVVEGTGPDGRIVRRDLEGATAALRDGRFAASSASGNGASGGQATEIALTPMRRAIARRLTESKSTVPHFYVTAHCRVDRLLELRREVNATARRKVSVNDFVLKAVAGALADVPEANTIWAGDRMLRFPTADVAVAVAVDGGLLTPVVRDVHGSTLLQVSETVADLAERARAGRLQQHELEGGAFAVSNLGMYGVDEFSAILNPPQSGILAVAAAKPRPVVGDDGALAVATVMTVTLSADHRVIDGAVAAEWIAAFTRRIENPVSVLL